MKRLQTYFQNIIFLLKAQYLNKQSMIILYKFVFRKWSHGQLSPLFWHTYLYSLGLCKMKAQNNDFPWPYSNNKPQQGKTTIFFSISNFAWSISCLPSGVCLRLKQEQRSLRDGVSGHAGKARDNVILKGETNNWINKKSKPLRKQGRFSGRPHIIWYNKERSIVCLSPQIELRI